jgi:cytochrome c peroxidase
MRSSADGPRRPRGLAAFALVLLAACGEGGEGASAPAPAYPFDLPQGFPRPVVPAANPMSDAKVALGRRLFYDVRLSRNETQSCGSCHAQRLAFTDGRARAVGSTGQLHRRSSMSLANVGYAASITWANSILPDLESQVLVPLFGDDPVELGMSGQEALLLDRLRADGIYPALFHAAFPEQGDPVTLGNLTRAIAAFQRTLLSGDSPYDRHLRGVPAALSPAALRGRDLFFGERFECFHCHGGFNFQDSVIHADLQLPSRPFHNTGLYDLDGAGAYPETDRGLYDQTAHPEDMGRFRAPSLRNVGVTAPYMHDGSIATLEEVLDHYAAGGRAALVNGVPSPLRSGLVQGFRMTLEERADVVAFLESLTDETFLADPRFSDPFAVAANGGTQSAAGRAR